MSVTIYHNPRCSKSRQTLALLRDNGVEPSIVEYLDNMPSSGQLKGILTKLGLGPRDILRTMEAKEEGLDPGLEDDALIDAIVANPRVLQRPIVVSSDKACIGRPPEHVLDIF